MSQETQVLDFELFWVGVQTNTNDGTPITRVPASPGGTNKGVQPRIGCIGFKLMDIFHFFCSNQLEGIGLCNMILVVYIE